MNSSVSENLRRVRERIAISALAAGRFPDSVRLIAVSKTQPAAAVAAAARAGQLLFGENYVQELTDKTPEVQEPVEWHFIGGLQSNKVKYLAGLVSMIHSVDRLSLAEEINRQWQRLGAACDILIQVNIACEVTKCGTSIDEVANLVRQISKLPNVRVCGLMTMPPFFDDPEGARPYFRALREIAAEISSLAIPGVSMSELSMGMSGDYEVAVEEGSTLVRVGSAIFGARRRV